MLIGSAVDQIKSDNPDAEQRRVAHRIKLNGLLAMNDIASSDDPYTQMLDLLVMVTLQSRVWIDELGAERAFGPRAQILIQAMREARVEAWQLAGRTMTETELETVDYLIWNWRRKNPGIGQVEFIKFDGFADGRAKTVVSELKSGGGLLAPISEANEELRQYRRLAERAFWYTKRAPNIAGIQAEAAANEILAAPEIGKLIDSVNSATASGDRVSKVIADTPAIIERERKAALQAIDDRAGLLNGTVDRARATIQDATKLSESATRLTDNLNTLVANAGAIAGKYVAPIDPNTPPATQPAKSFEINGYTAAFGRLNDVVQGANQLTTNGDKLARSDGLRQGLAEMTAAADARVRFIFFNVYVAILAVGVLAITYKFIAVRLTKTRPGKDHA